MTATVPPPRDAPPYIVVTGAAGWLGRALLERLATAPTPLRVLVHTAAEAAAVNALTCSSPARVEVVIGDVGRRVTSQRLFHGVPPGADVIHAAGVIHPRRVSEFAVVNADGTRHVLDAARRAEVRRLVYVSSNSPIGTNADPGDIFRADEPYHPYLGYGHSKMLAELAVLDADRAGLDTVIVRPPWFYGPHQPPRQTTFFRLVRRGRFPIVGDGRQRRSMVFVGNLVDGLLLAARSPAARGRSYWIADERPYEVREIVATVGEALRNEGYEVAAPGRGIPAIVGRAAEFSDRCLQRVGLYQQQLHVLGEMDKTIACDISRAGSELGYRPAVSLFDGMVTSIRWCRAQGFEL